MNLTKRSWDPSAAAVKASSGRPLLVHRKKSVVSKYALVVVVSLIVLGVVFIQRPSSWVVAPYHESESTNAVSKLQSALQKFDVKEVELLQTQMNVALTAHKAVVAKVFDAENEVTKAFKQRYLEISAASSEEERERVKVKFAAIIKEAQSRVAILNKEAEAADSRAKATKQLFGTAVRQNFAFDGLVAVKTYLSNTLSRHGADYGSQQLRRKSHQEAGTVLHLANDKTDVDDIAGLDPVDAPALCELMILGVEACDEGFETYVDCLLHFGVQLWNEVLQPQCRQSLFWRELTQLLAQMFPSALSGIIGAQEDDDAKRVAVRARLLDLVAAAAVPSASREEQMRVKWDEVVSSHYDSPKRCTVNNNSFTTNPISYGLSRRMYRSFVTRRKIFDWYPILPGIKPLSTSPLLPPDMKYRPTFHLRATDEYLNTLLLRFSRFSWSHIRGGPDAMRHYETLSQGCVPVYIDIQSCFYPLCHWSADDEGFMTQQHTMEDCLFPECLANLPKALMVSALSLPGLEHLPKVPVVRNLSQKIDNKYFYFLPFETFRRERKPLLYTDVINFKRPGTINHSTFDEKKYFDIADRLLEESRRHATCGSVVKSLLERVGFKDAGSLPRSILLVGFPYTDYITYTLECGLNELGLNYTVSYRFWSNLGDNADTPREIHRDANESAATMNGSSFVRSVQRLHGGNYGLGYATAKKVDIPPNPQFESQEEMCRAVRDDNFDFYIIAHKSPRFVRESCFADALAHIGAAKMALVDGDDINVYLNFTEYATSKVNIFSREYRCDVFR